MKWINTQELTSILQRFPNEHIAVSAYLGCGLNSIFQWSYSTEEKRFLRTIGTKSKTYSKAELYRLYDRQHWKVKSSFFIRDNHEERVAVRLVKELGMLGLLEDIISGSELDCACVCEHCHHLMDEGWLVDDIRTFCSDECLRSAFPEIDISELQTRSLDVNCQAYWTKWEE